jgi:hypothetical protein
MSAPRRPRPTLLLLGPALVVAGGLASVWGCNPHKDQIRPESLFARIGRQTGEIIEPRKCAIRVAIVDRPFRDAAINEVVWKAADEQAIAPQDRRALEVNGLKLGQLTGEFPPALESVLNAPPPHKVEPATFLLDDGEQTLISISDPVDQVSLLLNREGRAYGRDFEAAGGFFRVVATHHGTNGVSLRFTPEIHHGPIQRSFPALSDGSPYAPQQFKISDGQQQEALRDLSATISLEPNQVAIVGCRPEQPRSLGAFLFTRAGSGGDERRQKLILVWATRNQVGTLGEKPARSDRPRPGSGLAAGQVARDGSVAQVPEVADRKANPQAPSAGASSTAH